MFNKASEIIKKIPVEKVIYPAITLLFAAAVLISFNKTIFFITENINKVFSSDESSIKKEVPRFDAENYELIRKRFNWPQIQMPAVIPEITLKEEKTEAKKTATTTETAKTPEKTEAAEEIKKEEVKKTEAPEIIAEKSLISISIFNGSEISEAAEKLKASLVAAGFETIKIEERQLSIDTTIIQTKPVSKKNQKYITEIKQIVSKEYSPQISADLSDSVDYDVMIIVGKK